MLVKREGQLRVAGVSGKCMGGCVRVDAAACFNMEECI